MKQDNPELLDRIKSYFSLPDFKALSLSDWTAGQAMRLTSYFYWLLFFISVLEFEGQILYLNRSGFNPKAPLFWTKYFEYGDSVAIIGYVFVIGALLGAFFYRHRLARLAAFVGILEYHALKSSFGQPEHQTYLWLYVAFLFIFLPDIWSEKKADRDKKQNFLIIFWGSQALVLLTYFMSGLGKVLAAYTQYDRGELHAFSPDAMALHISDWLINFQQSAPLAEFIVEHPFVGWPFFLAAIYFQFFAIVAIFKPNIQRTFAFGLSLFHFGTFVFMGITFIHPIPVLMLLFFDSPFRQNRDWKAALGDMPIFGWLLKPVLTKE